MLMILLVVAIACGMTEMKENKILQDDINPNGFAIIKSFNNGDFCWRIRAIEVSWRDDPVTILSAYSLKFIIDVANNSREIWKECGFVFGDELQSTRNETLERAVNYLVASINSFNELTLPSVIAEFKNILDNELWEIYYKYKPLRMLKNESN